MTATLHSSPNITQSTTGGLRLIAGQFYPEADIQKIEPFGSGNINDTYRVTLANPDRPYFVLQRINTQIFRQPDQVMHNIQVFTTHVSDRLQRSPETRRWEVPRVLSTAQGQPYWQDPSGSCWRALEFIDHAESFDTVQNANHARETGTALGIFHRLMSDLRPEQLHDTLAGFHITPQYLQQYDDVLSRQEGPISPEVDYCHQFVRDRRELATVLETAKQEGELQLRLMHGDPKINNILIDRGTGQAVSIIDLDTLKPGLIHYDIGDCLRSSCNLLGEETQDWQAVQFDIKLCQQILEGYLDEAKSFLTPTDYDYLYDAVRVITFELGLRFFTDYLAGNIYFKTRYPEHNLARALVQFKLTESIEQQEKSIRSLVTALQ
jgi:Ser/Thr protein kinase RdoA (MazF antagonist)